VQGAAVLWVIRGCVTIIMATDGPNSSFNRNAPVDKPQMNASPARFAALQLNSPSLSP
jgi:hypothetical protein